MKTFFIVNSLILGLAAGLLLFYTPVSLKAKSKVVLWGSYYDNKHAKAFNGIQKAFKVPARKMKAITEQITHLKAIDPLFRANAPTLPAQWNKPHHPMTKKVISLLIQSGLNPHAVEIIINDGGPNIACAKQCYYSEPEQVVARITVNAKELNKRPRNVQESILLHEMRHLIEYDSLEEGYILSVLQEMGYTRHAIHSNPSMIAFKHLKELRADQMAAITHGIPTAKAFKHDLLNCTIHDESHSHPSSRKRAAHMNVVLNHLHSATKSA